MIKAVLLDSDDTLLDFTKAEHIALQKTLREVGIEPEEETIKLYSEINKRHWEMLERGELTREEVLVQRFDRFFEAMDFEGDSVSTQQLYNTNLGIGHYFVPGAVEFLQSGEREWRQRWEGLRGQVVDRHLHGPRNHPRSPYGWKARLQS